mmetsp:Transcript_5525/g.15558  ORF Transcript_5525/g.15558 Transcript_5525/m.15558 type:complete len:285 (+) Transcript_5525:844-1698(+)
MGLRLKEGIEIPKAAFHPLVGGHFAKAHLQENFAKFRPHLEQGMQVPAADGFAERDQIVRFEGCRFPGAAVEHLLGQVGRLLDALRSVGGTALDLDGFDDLFLDEFALFQVGSGLARQRVQGSRPFRQPLQIGPGSILDLIEAGHGGDQIRTLLGQPPFLHALGHANLAHVLSNEIGQLAHRDTTTALRQDGRQNAVFLRSLLQHLTTRLRDLTKARLQIPRHDVPVGAERFDHANHLEVIQLLRLRPRIAIVNDRRGIGAQGREKGGFNIFGSSCCGCHGVGG